MELAIVALTTNGVQVTKQLLESGLEADVYLYSKLKIDLPNQKFNSLSDLTSRLFVDYDGIIFITALGIVVRVIAPYLKDKRSDPAVITVDEQGQQVISTLSGHLGGANKLTNQLAKILSARPVVTTATDCQDKPSFDLLAERLNCQPVPEERVKAATAALVNNKQVTIYTDYELDLKLAPNLTVRSLQERKIRDGFSVIISNRNFRLDQLELQLVPQNLIVGIGCRRGVKKAKIKAAILTALKSVNRHRASLKRLATIDLKADETGILQTAQELGVELEIIERQEIKTADFNYTTSEFVRQQIGVGGVCEPAAILTAANKGQLLAPKQSHDGVTTAVVEVNCT